MTNANNGYVTNCNQLGTTQPTDKILTNAPIYITGALGRFYYPTNDGRLQVLLDVGSRSAANASLYHYTVRTTDWKEASSTVDIGYHYVATASGQAVDTDADGTPDYLEDLNGNGSADAGETDWSTYNSPNGLLGSPGLQVFTPLR